MLVLLAQSMHPWSDTFRRNAACVVTVKKVRGALLLVLQALYNGYQTRRSKDMKSA
jgi:hypothetical protein